MLQAVTSHQRREAKVTHAQQLCEVYTANRMYMTHQENVMHRGTIGCPPNSVPMVFIVFSRESWGL